MQDSKLIIGISSRALFDLDESHEIYKKHGLKSYEEYLLQPRLKEWSEKNQDYDVDEFIKLANSVLNRRKSRAGHSLENHLNKIFIDSKIAFNHQAVTENNNKPDFLFPGKKQYDDSNYPTEKLSLIHI